MLGQATTTLDKMAPRLGAPTWPKFQQAFVEAADVVVAVALKKVQYQKFHCQYYYYIHTYILLFFRETDMVVVDRVMAHLFDHIEEEELYQTVQYL